MKPRTQLLILFVAVCFKLTYGSDMNTLWTGVYDLGGHDVSTGAIVLGDNLLLSGHSHSLDYETGVFAVLCLSMTGDSLWSRYYGSGGLGRCDAICNYGNGFIVVGSLQPSASSRFAAMIVRCNAEGDTIWTRLHETDSASFHVLGVIETANHEILLLGFEQLDSAQYGWICRMSEFGGIIWSKRIYQRGWDTFVDAVELEDGSILAGGTAQSPPMYNYMTADMQLVHLSGGGDSLASRLYGGDNRERFYSLDQFGEHRTVVTGYTESSGHEMGDAYLICTDLRGDSLWSRTYGGEGMDHMHDGISLHDGTIFISGHSEMIGGSEGGGDFYSVRTDSEGNEMETGFFGGPFWENSEAVIDVGNIVFSAGYSISFSESYDFCVAAYSFAPLHQSPHQGTIAQSFELSSYPNPFNQTAMISFDLPTSGLVSLQAFDLNGRLVSTLADGTLPAGRHAAVFDASNLSSGTYFVQMRNAVNTKTLKTILLK